MSVKKIEIKDNPKQDVVVAVDISDNDINLTNLKKTVKTNRIVIEIESDKDFALGEIEVLGR